MRFLFAVIFLVVSIFLLFGLRFDIEVMVIGLATILGFALGKVFDLQGELNGLRATLARMRATLAREWEERNATKQSITTTSDIATQTATKKVVHKATDIEKPSTPVVQPRAIAEELKAETSMSDTSVSEIKEVYVENVSRPIEKNIPIPINDTLFDKAGDVLKGYFTGGNLFVRIGIIILFFGVSFLLKYVSDQGLFPIEYRLIGVVVLAMAFLGLGWRLRLKNETYALLLQGAGIGILYLDIYAAFSLYDLLPPMAAFALLFVVSMFSAALAVLQDSRSLAVLGFSGGFIAPVLASSGSNNYVGLFSYYAILNLAIVVVAWFKSWRALNLLGFAFTFIIGTAWGVMTYKSENFASVEPFLILFFLFYVVIAVLFALRQPPKLRGYVDGTMLFGVPLAASGLQYSLVKDIEFGVSLSSFAMGAFYLVLSWFIWMRKGDGLKLLAEAFLALGVIFASMAIPFALAPTQTAAAWALEGAGLLWLGSRQDRLSVRFFGLILQFSAGLMFFYRDSPFSVNDLLDNDIVLSTVDSVKPFLNADFISAIIMAIAGTLSARLLIKPFKGRRSWEEGISPVVLIWGVLWLFGGFLYQLLSHYSLALLPTTLLLFTAIVSLLFTIFAIKTKPQWQHAWVISCVLFGLVLLLGLTQFGMNKYEHGFHPLGQNGWIAWPVVFVVYYFLLKQLEKNQVLQRFQSVLHSALLILLTVLVTFEGVWQLKTYFPSSSDWMGIWMIVPTVVALWVIIGANFWPFSTHKEIYRQQTGVALAAVMSIWSFLALGSEGSSDPLPWLPLINPLDITSIIIFITLFKWWQTISDNFALVKNQNDQHKSFNKRTFAIMIAGLIFLWLNITLFRVAYHWFDVSYNAHALYNSSLIQTSVSILWALSGVLVTVYASRKKIRFLWIGGAFILGLVVLKLFVIDFSTLGSLARIISFLVVGILLTSIGYFAPLPERDEALIKQIENAGNTEKDANNV